MMDDIVDKITNLFVYLAIFWMIYLLHKMNKK